MVLGAAVSGLVEWLRCRAWSGGFDETVAAPSDGLTAEHERTRNPFGTRKARRAVRATKGTEGVERFRVRRRRFLRLFVFSPAGESKGFSVFQCPPKAVSACSVVRTHGTRGVGAFDVSFPLAAITIFATFAPPRARGI